ncbi:alanine dehydrogenase/pyridine nucleotide transhydrogenase domain-containing protein [Toxoplasma gondii TgCatPRC2]|uniref:alanine dehydrogenase n=14 Tax=Toxoplasma gondii TaxID=5811 RepID=B9PUB1_TOXGV|nr:alanine dehydrogenase/pyridine nucleotide transhydrogenase domain-containing protein [Toxoplasma gondii ME49]EPR61692.1 alanine dehydrogenase/pyridine nucleotide transhydrogenase domain-containing protein [Toxoplasma gondii GT1]ESS33091.1 alanine dehydrogenase/pyridine nucleotide transhydrogenase domain-containing protein [Toxoplasma gondii VEG]KAF4642823.1 alanine dehydrogenase/pyridine nucleotide transhydrogenase domain-containing protein [Toxoplasma gondii]KFG37891.1 alanine dehydrogenase|eukprot:XP_002367632.1 alanine dehydrogenase/pyridine nucleotide transhydrogenase domain-containing protein [Toxoplasma gondii ME49]
MAPSTTKMATLTSQLRFSTPATSVMESSTIGCPKEVMPFEYRVALTPATVAELVNNGHKVVVQTGAGVASGFTDESYTAAGATMVQTTEEVYKTSQMIVKVQAPQPQEYSFIQPGQVIFAFFSFENNKTLFETMMQREAVCFSYEQMKTETGTTPILQAMCEISGQLAISQAMKYLEKTMGGSGCMLGTVTGMTSGYVLVLGGGVAAMQAARVAASTGAQVCIMDVCMSNMRTMTEMLPKNCTTMYFCTENLVQQIQKADVVIGAVFGSFQMPATVTNTTVMNQKTTMTQVTKAPMLVKKEHVAMMKPGSVIVDLAVSRGGNFETTQPTTLETPTFICNNVIHYCVPNMPSAVPQTSSVSLANNTLAYVLQVANNGWKKACVENSTLMEGLMVAQNTTTNYMLSQVYTGTVFVPSMQMMKNEMTMMNTQTQHQTETSLADIKQQLNQIRTMTNMYGNFTVEA